MATYIYDIIPFNAQKDFMLTFAYSGSFQCFKNKLVIRNHTDLTIVFEDTVESFQLRHLIPEGTLKNGSIYLAQIYVYDSNHNICGISQEKQFKCLKEPVFHFKNIEENQIVENSGYTFELEYSQENGESLQSFQIFLYNAGKHVLFSSPILYDTSDLSYRVTSLSDDMQYLIRATGVTIHGIPVDSGYITFAVNYITPQQWFLLELKNVPNIGAIQVSSNMITLEGICSQEPIPFVDETYIDLRGEGVHVTFKEGFVIEKDGTLIGQGYCPMHNQTIVSCYDRHNHLRVDYKTGAFDSTNEKPSAYLDLYVTNADLQYYIYSNYIDIPAPTDIISFCILKQDNVYEIRFQNTGSSILDGEGRTL